MQLPRNLQALIHHPGWRFLWVALLVLPLVAFFPEQISQDGAAHVQNARLLELLLSGNTPQLYQEAYVLQLNGLNNWLDRVLLIGLSRAFGWGGALKALVYLYFVLFITGYLYLFTQLQQRLNSLVLLGLPAMFSVFLLMGFFNFLLGLALLLWLWGLWLKYLQHPKPALAIGLVLLVSVIYFAHPFAFFLCALGMLGLAAGYLVERRFERRYTLKVLVSGAVSALPALVGLWSYFRQLPPSDFRLPPLSATLGELAVSGWLEADEGSLGGVAKALVEVFAGSGILLLLIYYTAGNRLIPLKRVKERFFGEPGTVTNPAQKKGLACLLLLIAVAYVLLPNKLAGGGYVHNRLLLTFFLSLGLWLVTVRLRRAVQGYFAGIAFALLVLNGYQYLRLQQEYQEAVGVIRAAAKTLPQDSEVLFLNYAPSRRTLHFSNYILLEKRVLLYENYEGYVATFPVKYRPGSWFEALMKTAKGMDGLESRPAWFSTEPLQQLRPGKPDFVFTYLAPDPDTMNSGRPRQTLQWLSKNYTPAAERATLPGGLKKYVRKVP